MQARALQEKTKNFQNIFWKEENYFLGSWCISCLQNKFRVLFLALYKKYMQMERTESKSTIQHLRQKGEVI